MTCTATRSWSTTGGRTTSARWQHPDVSYEGANPLCGDRLTMMLDLDESGTVTDVAFTGRGCAISQASASMLTDTLRGRSTDGAGRARQG